MRVLVTGASGSGTSTLGAVLAEQIGAQFLDADDFLWLPTDPPYRQKRTGADRLASMLAALECHQHSVVAGSVMNWGPALEDAFSIIVFLQVDTAVRIERLLRREIARFGQADPAFIEWAAQYDAGSREGRSLASHEAWLAARSCQVIRFAGVFSTAEQLRILAAKHALPVDENSRAR